MKELSIEEKAQRYDEAVNEIKNLRDMLLKEGVINKNGIICDNFDRIFPELKESEDEEIRKALIKYLDALDDDEIRYGVSFKDMRTWLEKQSKASKVEQAMREVEEKAEAFTEAHKGETSEEILAQMRGEQKPAWSEEDDYNLQCCIAKVQYDIDNGRIGRNREILTWLKSLKDRVIPQPKQEWSEEDKDNFKHLLDEIVCLGNNKNSANRLYYDRLIKFITELKNRAQPKEKWCDKDERMLDRLIAYFEKQVAFTEDDNPRYANWLKSLRPQNIWKPSEEQMEVLKWCIPLWVEPKSKAILESLINDLKKLMEE